MRRRRSAARGFPDAISFYASEGGQELRPSFALCAGAVRRGGPVRCLYTAVPAPPVADASPAQRFFALALGSPSMVATSISMHRGRHGAVEVPAHREARAPPAARGDPDWPALQRGRRLRLIYAPAGETTGHLTFRVEHMEGPDGRPVLAAMELLLHARRAYGSAAEFTLGGLLAESRHRQADVTEKLAKQVFEAVELLVAGFEAAAARDGRGEHLDWLRPALEAEGGHLYQGIS